MAGTTPRYALFDTPIGRCGVAWGQRGLAGLQLPEASDRATAHRLCRDWPDAREAAPPPAVQQAIEAIVELLRGRPSDLSSIALELDRVPPFHRRVYAIAREIEPGRTMTYGEIATRLGDAGAARAVGQALGANPWAIVVPCHRVLAAGGRSGGFSARGGVATKLRLLSIEGAQAAGASSLPFDAPA
jgi:methylated-DNA-[protein]-cysteine S-methyltransferase